MSDAYTDEAKHKDSVAEAGEIMKKMEGTKHDDGKLPWHLMPMTVIRDVLKILVMGRKKYAAWNWSKGMAWSRLYDAAMRHIDVWWWDGEDLDPESGLHHLSHAICDLIFLRWYDWHHKSFDDRPRVQYMGDRAGKFPAAVIVQEVWRDSKGKRFARTIDPPMKRLDDGC